jgi:hypothetical protein
LSWGQCDVDEVILNIQSNVVCKHLEWQWDERFYLVDEGLKIIMIEVFGSVITLIQANFPYQQYSRDKN